MKKILVIPLLLVFTGCFSSQVYLPHTSRVFHKKKCIALNDPSPIVYQSAQQAMSTGGVSPCSVCIKDRDFAVSSQGYTSINYATNGQGGAANSNMNYIPPARSKTHKMAKFAVNALIIWANSYSKVQQARIDQRKAQEVDNGGRIQTWDDLKDSYYNPKSSTADKDTYDAISQMKLRSPSEATSHTPLQIYERRSYPFLTTTAPPIQSKQWQPMESPFKGSGLLDEKYSNPPATGSGILGN